MLIEGLIFCKNNSDVYSYNYDLIYKYLYFDNSDLNQCLYYERKSKIYLLIFNYIIFVPLLLYEVHKLSGEQMCNGAQSIDIFHIFWN
jgi:hypothetical protein